MQFSQKEWNRLQKMSQISLNALEKDNQLPVKNRNRLFNAEAMNPELKSEIPVGCSNRKQRRSK